MLKSAVRLQGDLPKAIFFMEHFTQFSTKLLAQMAATCINLISVKILRPNISFSSDQIFTFDAKVRSGHEMGR